MERLIELSAPQNKLYSAAVRNAHVKRLMQSTKADPEHLVLMITAREVFETGGTNIFNSELYSIFSN